jgi:hypothetical protein
MKPDRIALFGYAHVPWVAKNQQMIEDDTLPNAALALSKRGPRPRLWSRTAISKLPLIILSVRTIPLLLPPHPDACIKATPATPHKRSSAWARRQSVAHLKATFRMLPKPALGRAPRPRVARNCTSI